MSNDEWRRIPSVGVVLEAAEAEGLLEAHPRILVRAAVREVLQQLRKGVGGGERARVPATSVILELVTSRLAEGQKPSLRRVVNATGVVLHTNMGRAPLPQAAVEAIVRTAGGYSNLELDLGSGGRGSRQTHLEELVRELTGAEGALVVNNNAAAVLLSLSALAQGREVIVSRGELVEIGGSFRVPEVLEQSGAVLREVGTTNKTHPNDYRRATGPATGLILRVHQSNYRIMGFTAQVERKDLVRIAREAGILLVEDLGSGTLVDFSGHGLPHEPTVQEAVGAGVDLVTFSGDKLLGGPQAGIVAGRRELVERLRSHPLARALRVDKLQVAALEATLRLYREGREGEIPVLRALTVPVVELRERAEEMAALLEQGGQGKVHARVLSGEAPVGGGSLPGVFLSTYLVGVAVDGVSPAATVRQLLEAVPPVVARVQDEEVLFDLRTVLLGEGKEVVAAVLGVAEVQE